MTILCTGCAGFIGSNFCNWLIENTNHTIVGIDDLSGGFESNCPDDFRFKFYKLDVRADYLNNVFQFNKPDVCFHFASYAAEGRSNYIRRFIHSNNTVGCCNIINACLDHKCKLIFTSSVAVYSGVSPYNEETIENPIDEYGLSKLTSEKSIQIAGTQGLDWCIVRPRNVYGERQSLWDSARNVIGIWINQIKNKEPMTIFGDGSNRRTFTYIGDLLFPLYNAIQVSKEIINIGSPISYSIQEANEVLQLITDYIDVKYLEERHEVAEAICDTTKSEELLNYHHNTSLLSGLTKMWEWARYQPNRQMQIPPPLEINIKAHSSIK